MSTAFLATGFSVGYCVAVIANFFISPFGWRFVFLFGIIPAILVFFIRRKIKEPDLWMSIKDKIHNPFEIFKKEYSYNLWTAFFLGVTCTIGSWTCILFWMPIWVERTLGGNLNDKTIVIFISMLTHVFGSYCAGPLLSKYKRKPVLFVSYLMTFLTAFIMYFCFHNYGIGVLFFSSLLGFFFGIIPASFAIYFPELFPTKIRTTAKGFCYSTGRVFSAFGVLYSGFLVQKFEGNIGTAAALMSITFLVGAVVSLFIKETNRQALPE